MSRHRNYQAVCETCEPKESQPDEQECWHGIAVSGKPGASNAVRIHNETWHDGESHAEIREVDRE